MAVNEKLAERIRKLLAPRNDVEEKKMFRGLVFMVNKKMCISVSDSRIMCRIDPLIHDKVLKTKTCETVIMGGRTYKGFVYIDETKLKTKEALNYWVNLALDFNKIAKASSSNRKSPAVRSKRRKKK